MFTTVAYTYNAMGTLLRKYGRLADLHTLQMYIVRQYLSLYLCTEENFLKALVLYNTDKKSYVRYLYYIPSLKYPSCLHL
jgi:hypothetical protein